MAASRPLSGAAPIASLKSLPPAVHLCCLRTPLCSQLLPAQAPFLHDKTSPPIGCQLLQQVLQGLRELVEVQCQLVLAHVLQLRVQERCRQECLVGPEREEVGQSADLAPS